MKWLRLLLSLTIFVTVSVLMRYSLRSPRAEPIITPPSISAGPTTLRTEHFDLVVGKHRLQQVGDAYRQAYLQARREGRPSLRGPQELQGQAPSTDAPLLLWGRTPLEVLWDVDDLVLDHPNLPLAWEREPDREGGRLVLLTGYGGIKYVNSDEFQAMKAGLAGPLEQSRQRTAEARSRPRTPAASLLSQEPARPVAPLPPSLRGQEGMGSKPIAPSSDEPLFPDPGPAPARPGKNP